ncbi:HNH endonuclease signature motif containing protein [Paractinoplanes globisporus]|uniref:DUF222 domain-containing protein n=1 Tax=Paractinoplanes globisporus TaxID=113565 RepID=A0ABW6WTX1_9ACTN|nr:HNH endonuclease signature motif containing protein [Actinoplanes globisporus]
MLDEVTRWGEEAAKAAGRPLWPLPDAELLDLLRAVHRLQQASATLQIRVIRETTARNLPAQYGHRTVPSWLRDLLRLDPQPARELAEAAAALSSRPAAEQALLDGVIDLRQATVIANAVNALPATLADLQADAHPDTDPDANPDTGEDTTPIDGHACGPHDAPDALAEQAEATLIGMATQFPAHQLRKLGDRILAHLAPQIADQADESALRRAEARAHRQRCFTLSMPVDGMVRLSGALGIEDAAIVTAALQPLSGPAPGDDRSFPQRRADALVDVCRLALRTAELPHDGGEPPQLALTIRFNPLAAAVCAVPSGAVPSVAVQSGAGRPGTGRSGAGRSGAGPVGSGRSGAGSPGAQGVGALGPGILPNGERISAATVRRLACDARILPLVLGGTSQVLDAGRGRRLAHGALRRALTVRDGGCAFPGCDRPARWCDAHHLRSWSDGGPTDLDNLVLLCRHHHRLLHAPDGGWRAELGTDRLPTFVPPPWIDLQQRPRRNLYHPRT